MPQVWANLLASLGISSFAIWQAYKHQQRTWLWAWVFYLIALSPVIGLLQVGTQAAADRYAYLPTLPFYLLLAMGCV